MAVEDIFAQPGTSPVPQPPSQRLGPEDRFTPEEKPKKRGILWVLISLVVLLVGAGVFFTWRSVWSDPQVSTTPPTPADPNLLPEQAETEVPTNHSTLVNQAPASPDQDRDGLTQAEEVLFGTSDQDPDTDDDGLNDKEEIKIYATDPNDPDTDGDTFLDGEEVRHLYNPKGPGKLFSLENIQS